MEINMNLRQSSSIEEFNVLSMNRTRIARIFMDACAFVSSAVNISLFLLSYDMKNHRERRGHREKQQTSVLSVSFVVNYSYKTCLKNNYIHQS